MRSAAWITSRAWSRYATKARAATTAMPKIMRTGLDRRVARGRVDRWGLGIERQLGEQRLLEPSARARLPLRVVPRRECAGCAAKARVHRRHGDLGPRVRLGLRPRCHRRLAGASAGFGRASLPRRSISVPVTPSPAKSSGTLAVRRSRRSARPRESACHCGSGRPGTGCGARPAVKASSGELPLYGWRRARSSYARHASPYTSSLGCG